VTEELFIFGLIRPQELLIGVFVFVRISAMMFFLPVFGDTSVPVRVRIFASIGMALLFYPIVVPNVAWNDPDFNFIFQDSFAFAFATFKELFIGAVIGFVAHLIFESILMSANIVGYQMGFGMANFFLPDGNSSTTAFAVFHRMIVLLIFFSLSLHHIFIGAVAYSFDVIPVGLANILVGDVGRVFVELSANLFVIALQISAPILVALLFTMAALGLVARAVPQMHIFTMSFPVSFFAGLIIYAACFPYLADWMKEHFQQAEQLILANLRALSGNTEF
jgi:flagellar biosynthesis protein FliR